METVDIFVQGDGFILKGKAIPCDNDRFEGIGILHAMPEPIPKGAHEAQAIYVSDSDGGEKKWFGVFKQKGIKWIG